MGKDNDKENEVINESTSSTEPEEKEAPEKNGSVDEDIEDEVPANSAGEFIGDGDADTIDKEEEEKDDEKDEDFGSKKKKPKTKAARKSLSKTKVKRSSRKIPPKTKRSIKQEEEYEVQDIVGHREIHGRVEYKIRWKGYGPSGDTWEPIETLSCPDILSRYDRKVTLRIDMKLDQVLELLCTHKLDAKKRKPTSSPRAPPKKTKYEPRFDDEDDEEEEEEEAEYEVERLIDCREKRNGSREFLVHWKGWSQKFDSWEPEDNLNCQDLIGKFLENLEKSKGAASKGVRVVKKKPERFTVKSLKGERRNSRRSSTRARVVYTDD